MAEESSPLLPPADESIEAETDTAIAPEPESGEATIETNSEPGFVCDCEVGMHLACQGLPFYKKLTSRRYCVLHYPGNEKSADFKRALESKLNRKDFDFRGVWFPDQVHFDRCEFSTDANFISAMFSAEAYFGGASFSGGADFGRALFSGGADFEKATFRGFAGFNEAAFSDDANFRSAKFSAAAHFSSAKFGAAADFSSATFEATAVFGSATFATFANFESATFCLDAIFNSVIIGPNANASFEFADFRTMASFTSATFSGDANFSSATFGGHANFNAATFGTNLYLSLATFGSKGDFGSATFAADAYFSHSEFRANVDFRKATFRKDGCFSGCVFSDHLSFSGSANERSLKDGTRLEKRALGTNPSLDFQYARFEKPERVSFHTLTLRPHWFVNVDPRRVTFTDVSWDWSTRWPNFGWPKRYIKAEIDKLTYKAVSSPKRLLAIACHQLAENSQANNLYEDASQFRYLAMRLARQEKWSGVLSLNTDWLHVLYGATSGYGERILRALSVLAAVWIVFAVLYTWVGFTEQIRFPRALTYSLGVMSLQKPDPKPITGTAQTLVTLETILGPVQAALLALAIRRKFMR